MVAWRKMRRDDAWNTLSQHGFDQAERHGIWRDFRRLDLQRSIREVTLAFLQRGEVDAPGRMPFLENE